MSWNARRAFIVLLPLLLAVSAAWLEQGHAQVKGVPAAPFPVPGVPGGAKEAARPDGNMDPDGFLKNGIHLVKDEKRRGDQIQAAIDYITDEKWATAVELLQKLLEINEDVFVRLKRTNAEGNEVYVWVSAKQEADRLLGTLPPAGLDFYKATYGAKAAELLKKAKKNGDPGLLGDIMKRYAHTDAGGEAIKLLGDYKFDRGEYMPALLCYSKLINRLGADKAPFALLAKAAWAAHLAPPSSSDQNTVLAAHVFSEKELWKMLRSRTREVQLGEQAISVEDLQEYVAKLDRTRLEQNAAESLIYRAALSRSNQLIGGPAFMRREWGVSLLYDDKSNAANAARERIKQAKSTLKSQNQPIIPAFAPITLSVLNGKGEKIPLLIYKNFYGVFAVDLRNGAPAWHSVSYLSLQRLLGQSGGKQQAVNEWLNYYVVQNQHPQILFENSTVGTLSTDGQFVYTVEDFAVPPTPRMNLENGMIVPGAMQNQAILDRDLEDAVAHNKLCAISLAQNSGKLAWSLGEDEKDPLGDHYFLGPPLPLAGKLYLLADKQQEIRLICLENSETRSPDGKKMTVPRIVSTQTLGMTQEKMQSDPLRRTWAAHLAYGEGILVCPTNAGAVFGVNLLENSLVWAYPYRDKSDVRETPPMEQQLRMMRRGMTYWQQTGLNVQNEWKVTAPVISDGKVVFTAPDARSIHCINLRDGSPIWKRPKRDDDLYLGNVYNGKVLIVGKKNVRALSLASGDELPGWPVPTGTPSGQGIGSDNVYYLPLKDGGKGKEEPQIVGIDMDSGKIVSRSKSRPSSPDKNDADVPGNLIFAEGKVVSVTAFGSGDREEGEVAVYPQLKVKLAEMDDLIVKNPNDANALTERGELRLDKGDLPGAIDDLSTALQNNPSKQIRDKARAKLYDTLTVYITDHFNDAEKYLKDYEELCKIDLDAAPESERAKLEAEQRRRRATFLWLVGKGREEQGRLVEAFEKYQEFAREAGKQSELVPAVDDHQVKTAPDVWARGRIIDMMNHAKPEDRRPLEKLIAAKWEQLRQTNDLSELRAFVRMFGAASEAGKEARLELAERLMEQSDGGEEHPLLEAELELNQFRTGRHSPELAGRATEALARLYTRKGLLEDAAYCYRKLGKEYADIVIRDGKTGRQIYDDDAATDKRLLPYLDDPQPLGSVHYDSKYVKKESGEFLPPYNGQLFQFAHSGENLPYFRHHIVGLNFTGHRFTLLDRNLENADRTPKEVWSANLTPTMSFQMLSQQVLGQQLMSNPMNIRMGMGVPINPNNNPNARFPYATVGHLIVLPLGERVCGIDPVNRRVLWEKDLSQRSESVRDRAWQATQFAAVDPCDGTVLLTHSDNWALRLGQVSPFQGQTICAQFADRLSALDPLTGRVLWSRLDVHSRNYLFSDEDHVFVVELDGHNNPSSTRVFRAADGISVKAHDFTALFAKRLQVLGRYLLLAESGPTGGVVVRLYDIVTGQDVWKQKYAARSIVARSEDAGLTGVVEPNGKVHVIDLRAQKEVMSGEIEMDDASNWLKKVQSFYLLSDRQYYYFASQMAAQNGAVQATAASAVWTHLGMRTVPVSGYLHAFERGSGKYAWNSQIKEPQYLLLDQFQDLPLLFLAARSFDAQNAGMAGMPPGMIARRGMATNAMPIKVISIHKRTGKWICNEEKLPANTPNFFAIRVDPRANTVELLSQQLKITHYPAPAADSLKKTKPAASSRRSTQAPSARPVLRPAFDRARIREIAPPLPPG